MTCYWLINLPTAAPKDNRDEHRKKKRLQGEMKCNSWLKIKTATLRCLMAMLTEQDPSGCEPTSVNIELNVQSKGKRSCYNITFIDGSRYIDICFISQL